MTAAGPILARCDGSDRLVEADEALAALQVRLGGAFPGALAMPSLLALVRRSRTARLPLSGKLTIADSEQPLSFRARATPEGEGTRIEITEWRVSAEAWAGQDGAGTDQALLRQLAEAHVVLDAEQRVVSGMVEAADLGEFANALRQGFGRYWTDLVEIEGSAHRQPLHWRLLDGARLRVHGSVRDWKASVLPLRSGGFELLLVAETVLPTASPAQAETVPAADRTVPDWKGLLGRKLAPALRQPINRIIANAETIRTRLAGPLSEQYVAYAGDIAEAGRHLASLVEDLADLETVEADGFAPEPDHIDLADCARRAAGILGVRAHERGITLALPSADEQVPAIGEFRRVLQVLLNLIGNAIRYTRSDTTVSVDCGVDGALAWISVSDEGDGIAPEQAEKVFEKFERLGRSGDGGSGLGLYISRRLARAMGGELVVGNGAAGGARFVLSLPADNAAQASATG
ncbi:sensor histidine kinase [Novosphingobium taihuense]|uniref:histidine kinase n=1 Tax=Novosphingobium taihuense TaxID=260085 RepID=A0A7W7AGI5_9SPHN|nr:HAMP domain-containing sensor histidine kinase [Novosphingobium taihuense]MBB4615597.1 signal transduction histidine kinase [Novosphingobium taihuense]TWH82887.1 phospho-acceptor domain-containing protein [Novosphingobium taihuense]